MIRIAWDDLMIGQGIDLGSSLLFRNRVEIPSCVLNYRRQQARWPVMLEFFLFHTMLIISFRYVNTGNVCLFLIASFYISVLDLFLQNLFLHVPPTQICYWE